MKQCYEENIENDNTFFDRPFEEVEDGFIDDRGFYTTPNGSFWDDDYNYFNRYVFDSHGGSYDKYGIYLPGPDYNDKTGIYKDQKDYIVCPNKYDEKKNIELALFKLKEQEKKEKKLLKKFEKLEEESENSDDDDDNSFTYDEDDIKEAFQDALQQEIELSEILNPEVYTGIIERDFHLFVFKPKKQPEYVHIGANEKPICTCTMHNKDIDLNIGNRCSHIFFILNDILHLNTENKNLIYSEDELKNAFRQAEYYYPNIIRETYGIVKRKNFYFPSPKIYQYDINQFQINDDNSINEWKIKERLYARGIIADEFIFPGLTYSLIENTYNKFFYSEQEAKPTSKAFKKPLFFGRQLELDKLYNK